LSSGITPYQLAIHLDLEAELVVVAGLAAGVVGRLQGPAATGNVVSMAGPVSGPSSKQQALHAGAKAWSFKPTWWVRTRAILMWVLGGVVLSSSCLLCRLGA
jgi:hypothetical protein